jgi:hypothetical protein
LFTQSLTDLAVLSRRLQSILVLCLIEPFWRFTKAAGVKFGRKRQLSDYQRAEAIRPPRRWRNAGRNRQCLGALPARPLTAELSLRLK